jgi:hypothetical protein
MVHGPCQQIIPSGSAGHVFPAEIRVFKIRKITIFSFLARFFAIYKALYYILNTALSGAHQNPLCRALGDLIIMTPQVVVFYQQKRCAINRLAICSVLLSADKRKNPLNKV